MARDRPLAQHVPIDQPADRLARVVGAMHRPALLEGGPGFGAAGRWSVYAAEPIAWFTGDARGWALQFAPDRAARPPEVGLGDPLDAFGRLLVESRWERAGEGPGPDEPPFRGGLIGFFGYDLAPRLERLPRRAPAESRLPDVAFALYDSAITLDQETGRAVLSAYDLLDEGERALRDRIARWLKALARPVAMPPTAALTTPIVSNFTREGYLDAIDRAREYIRAGDIFQVNLSQRFAARGRIEPLDLYLRLRRVGPAPFAAFLEWDDLAVVSASPEWFYQVWGDRIVTRPIKGTRPRGRTPEEDARLAAELRSSAKDRAELTMIVDLERNDLGRVCRYGTVRVTELLAVESYAQVHHLVATVEGRLRPECGPIEVLRAVFPGGSITGAPKIRAMQIIDELEPTRRGLYTGAIGYYSAGASAFNIAIRTLLVEGDQVSYQVGGGIVADSVPELEFEETLHKGRGLRAVLEGAGS